MPSSTEIYTNLRILLNINISATDDHFVGGIVVSSLCLALDSARQSFIVVRATRCRRCETLLSRRPTPTRWVRAGREEDHMSTSLDVLPGQKPSRPQATGAHRGAHDNHRHPRPAHRPRRAGERGTEQHQHDRASVRRGGTRASYRVTLTIGQDARPRRDR